MLDATRNVTRTVPEMRSVSVSGRVAYRRRCGDSVTLAAALVLGTMGGALPLEVLPDTLAICRLPATAALPAWASAPAPFLTVSRTSEELSITVLQRLVPDDVRCERDYRALRVRGTLPPDLVGILLSIAEPLAKAGLIYIDHPEES